MISGELLTVDSASSESLDSVESVVASETVSTAVAVTCLGVLV